MTSKAKPVKAKALSKRLRAKLEACASGPDAPIESTRWSHTDARAILAALEHAKQPPPLYQCRRKCACLFFTSESRDEHEGHCG